VITFLMAFFWHNEGAGSPSIPAPNIPFREDVARFNNNLGGWSKEAWDDKGVMIGVVWETYKDGTEKIRRWDNTYFVRPVSKTNKGK
jgi:hypothetical protein